MFYSEYDARLHDQKHFYSFGNVMIDLETLSTRTNASIISIGAVEFNPFNGKTGNSILLQIDSDEWSRNGRHIDGDTIKWWFNQERDAIEKLTKLQSKKFYTLKEALCELKNFIDDCNIWCDKTENGEEIKERVKVWGNGATMDITILQSAYEYFNMNTPWKYWAVNDVRTIVDLNPRIKNEYKDKFRGTKHSPIDDCKYQIEYLTETLKNIEII